MRPSEMMKLEKEIIRVCGPDYEESDIPAYIRQEAEADADDERR